ncbi:hypothetical protein CCL07_14180 [Pseudomonas congelans]|uniref:hypothetical protein n=1 Tax=Pseudomonas congelans TaxID=200452 RepID=UPI000BB5A2ED|nr:hypothetical protein [Pseudomonas congelans]PBQ03983.1 hypothetical protein CCL07_14180 [Pseudomonas congelans]
MFMEYICTPFGIVWLARFVGLEKRGVAWLQTGYDHRHWRHCLDFNNSEIRNTRFIQSGKEEKLDRSFNDQENSL